MTVAQSAARLHAEVRRLGLDVVDMRAETHLELTQIGPTSWSGSSETEPAWITRLEDDPIVARRIPERALPSRLCYFLDGAQRTLPAYVVGTLPIVASIKSVAVLQRDPLGRPTVMPGMLDFSHHWIAPLGTSNLTLHDLLDVIRAHGGAIEDVFAGLHPDKVAPALNDYATMMNLAYDRANGLRAYMEVALLERWAGEVADDGWIVVDGALPEVSGNVLGLVKSFTRQYVTGEEASSLFRMRPGHRTSAFQVRDKWRTGLRTCWYQRFWDASGRDPRHALVRVETASTVDDTDEIDCLASWLMAERLPRATADQRWATLLYPVHYLEQILKRQLDGQTRGWPTSN